MRRSECLAAFDWGDFACWSQPPLFLQSSQSLVVYSSLTSLLKSHCCSDGAWPILTTHRLVSPPLVSFLSPALRALFSSATSSILSNILRIATDRLLESAFQIDLPVSCQRMVHSPVWGIA